jgi:hypothetical protein
MRAVLVISMLGVAAPAIAQPETAPADAAPIDTAPTDVDPPAEAPPAEAAPVVPADDDPATADVIAADTLPEVRARAVPRFRPWITSRLVVEAELYTQARMVRRAGEDLSELRLDRGELGGRLQLGPAAAAELRFEAVRSAVDGGALGIDGDSTVFRVKVAQLAVSQALGPVQLDGALGFVPDPWIRTLEDDYPVKPLSRTGSERMLAWPSTDLSAMLRATVGPVRASFAVGNGEGTKYPERNTGKTTTGVLEVVPVSTPAVRVSLAFVGRDGSIGVASIRDRRLGGAIAVATPWVRGGVEVVKAYGIGDRGDVEGLELAGWLDARIAPRVFVAARGATLRYSTNGAQSSAGGAIAVEPWRSDSNARGQYRLWLAVDRVTSSGDAMPIPGADPGDATTVMLIGSAVAPFTID